MPVIESYREYWTGAQQWAFWPVAGTLRRVLGQAVERRRGLNRVWLPTYCKVFAYNKNRENPDTQCFDKVLS
jgi:hypothetical protein